MKISRGVCPSHDFNLIDIVWVDDWGHIGVQCSIQDLAVPFKILVALEDVVDRACLGGPVVYAIVFRGGQFRFGSLIPFDFHYKIINSDFEIDDFDFRIENIYNFVKLLCFRLRNRYCTIPISILLIKDLKTSRFTAFLLSIA